MSEYIPYGIYTNPRTYKCKNCGEKSDSHGRSCECIYMNNNRCNGIDKWGRKCDSTLSCCQMIMCLTCCKLTNTCSRCGKDLKKDTYFDYKKLK